LSKFKLTLDELKDGDIVQEINGLTIYYQSDMKSLIGRVYIDYKNKRLELRDTENRDNN
jgi:Fe-S cluster assembly iron-binding protein IscA